MPKVDWNQVEASESVEEPEPSKQAAASPQLSYYYRNRAKVLAYQRHQYRLRRDEMRLAGREKYRENRKELLDKARAKYYKARASILEGRACAHCGFADPRALQVEQVSEVGMDEFAWRLKSGGMAYAEYIAKELEKNSDVFQLTCANCRRIKNAERRESRNSERKAR